MERENESQSSEWHWLWLALALGVFLILGSLAIPTYSKINERGGRTKASDNCKQIISTLKLYAADNNGIYPDAKLPDAHTSNEVFRELFKTDVADSEVIFGCPVSGDGNPDGNIGNAPDFFEALKPGENHWAMTKGQTDSSNGKVPLVFECPADTTWPPTWNAYAPESKIRGRAWSGGKVIIGFNDGSVEAMPLESTKGEHVGLRPRPDGTPIFSTLPDLKFEVLDVAR